MSTFEKDYVNVKSTVVMFGVLGGMTWLVNKLIKRDELGSVKYWLGIVNSER